MTRYPSRWFWLALVLGAVGTSGPARAASLKNQTAAPGGVDTVTDTDHHNTDRDRGVDRDDHRSLDAQSDRGPDNGNQRDADRGVGQSPAPGTSFAWTPEARRRVDDWVQANRLNPYGTREGYVYPNGDPTLDPATGQRMDRYDYILRQHPELRGYLSVGPDLTPLQQERLDAWLTALRSNPYGDIPGTTYATGTPLFQGSDGRTISRYDYLLARHPELAAWVQLPPLSDADRAKLDAWLRENGRNQYGDLSSTTYPNGGPQWTRQGKPINRYELILARHPELVDQLGLTGLSEDQSRGLDAPSIYEPPPMPLPRPRSVMPDVRNTWPTAIVRGRQVLAFRAAAGGYSPERRLQAFQQRLNDAVFAGDPRHARVEVHWVDTNPVVFVNDQQVVTVTMDDAAAVGSEPWTLAQQWADNLRAALHAPA